MRGSDDTRHDAFISFSNADRAWALRLGRDLKKRGFDIFSDQALRAGELWEPRLAAELEAEGRLGHRGGTIAGTAGAPKCAFQQA